jgi:uncharacterized protein (DUF1015 family)
MKTQPFRALRPDPGVASRLASVPYDVVDTDEARALAADNPDSFLHVSRPRSICQTVPTPTPTPSMRRVPPPCAR